MHDILLLGAGLDFTAAIQPGPTQAFLVSRVALAGCLALPSLRTSR